MFANYVHEERHKSLTPMISSNFKVSITHFSSTSSTLSVIIIDPLIESESERNKAVSVQNFAPLVGLGIETRAKIH